MSDSNEIVKRRIDYKTSKMDETQLNASPIEQMRLWLEEADAAGVKEPNAMALATASTDGTPSVRMVLLREVDERGLFFYTNLESRKGRELAQNQRAAVCFYFAKLDRQLRLEGVVSRCSDEKALAYFKSRPRGSQIAAWCSPQSQQVPHRDALESRYAEMEKKFEGQEIPLPPFWGGFLFVPHHFEFWQGRENRLHDRVTYRKEGRAWVKERLAP